VAAGEETLVALKAVVDAMDTEGGVDADAMPEVVDLAADVGVALTLTLDAVKEVLTDTAEENAVAVLEEEEMVALGGIIDPDGEPVASSVTVTVVSGIVVAINIVTVTVASAAGGMAVTDEDEDTAVEPLALLPKFATGEGDANEAEMVVGDTVALGSETTRGSERLRANLEAPAVGEAVAEVPMLVDSPSPSQSSPAASVVVAVGVAEEDFVTFLVLVE